MKNKKVKSTFKIILYTCAFSLANTLTLTAGDHINVSAGGSSKAIGQVKGTVVINHHGRSPEEGALELKRGLFDKINRIRIDIGDEIDLCANRSYTIVSEVHGTRTGGYPRCESMNQSLYTNKSYLEDVASIWRSEVSSISPDKSVPALIGRFRDIVKNTKGNINRINITSIVDAHGRNCTGYPLCSAANVTLEGDYSRQLNRIIRDLDNGLAELQRTYT